MIHLYQDTPINGGDALYTMSDVNINNPEDGQMLVYDASTQRWRNVTQKNLNDLAEVTDLTNVIATGSTNATGATIPKGLYFYLNDELCQAKSDIANGATFTLNTNYEVVTAGGLNSLNSAISALNSKFVTESTSHNIAWTANTWVQGQFDLSTDWPVGYNFVCVSADLQNPWADILFAVATKSNDKIRVSYAAYSTRTVMLSVSFRVLFEKA